MKAYHAYKDSGNGWIKNIPEHWSVLSLKRFSSLVNGSTPQSSTNEYWDGDIVWVTPTDLGGLKGRVISSSARKITEVGLNNCGASLTPKGSIILSTRAPIGHLALTDVQSCTNQGCKTIVPDLSRINNVYLYYYLFVFKEILQSLGQGSTFVELSSQNLKDFASVFPPLPEQQAIADFLDRKTAQIDTLIEKKQRQIDLLQEQRTALINHAVTKGLNPNVKMKDSGVEWLGEIPSRWEVVKLKYIGKAFIGLTYNPENVTDEENGTLVFRASNVQDGKIVFDDNVYVKMEIPERLITKVGDILICVRSGSRDLIGKNALIDEKSAGHAFGAFMTVFRSDINYFLSYVFKSQLFKVQSGIFNTSTVNQLTQGNLYDFQVAIPPIDEQEEIIQFLNNELSQIDETVNRVSKQIELLQEYRTALISEAVTGKIDVRTAE